MWTFIKLIFFPITFMFYVMKFGFMGIWYLIVFMFYFLKMMYYFILMIYYFILNVIDGLCNILGLFSKFNFSSNYRDSNTNYNIDDYSLVKPPKKKYNKTVSWKEENFEKEAKLWGLSEEDKRIAKEERMSPADFIEAEERDDDELFTDEWE